MDSIRKGLLLVVDDDELVLDSISTLMEMKGFAVSRCADSTSALAFLEKEQPDLLLTDIRMPGMSGTELLLQLRKRDSRLPVIVMSGYADIDCAIDAVKGGAFDFIKKPFDPSYLLQVVERAITHSRLLALEQEYLQRLEHEVAEKTAELERASRLKTEFLNNISHEIRTPVHGIQGMLSLARDADTMDERNACMALAESCARQLIRVVDDLVMLAGLLTQSIAPAFVATDMRTVVADVLQRVTSQYPGGKIRFEVTIATNVPQRLMLEKKLLELALFQLLENEAKYAAAGIVTITVDHDTAGKTVTIIVRDTGPGMSDELLTKVAEPFVQGDGSNTRLRGGLGIGLNIVCKIADFLKGSFKLHSEPSKGTEATLVIPEK